MNTWQQIVTFLANNWSYVLTTLFAATSFILGLFGARSKALKDKLEALKPAIMNLCTKAEAAITAASNGVTKGELRLESVLKALKESGVTGKLLSMAKDFISKDFIPSTKTTVNQTKKATPVTQI
jgi:hypothetical protein